MPKRDDDISVEAVFSAQPMKTNFILSTKDEESIVIIETPFVPPSTSIAFEKRTWNSSVTKTNKAIYILASVTPSTNVHDSDDSGFSHTGKQKLRFFWTIPQSSLYHGCSRITMDTYREENPPTIRVTPLARKPFKSGVSVLHC